MLKIKKYTQPCQSASLIKIPEMLGTHSALVLISGTSKLVLSTSEGNLQFVDTVSKKPLSWTLPILQLPY